MIKIIVFDMDGVLCRYRIERRLARLAAWSGKSPEAIHAAIWGSGFEDEAERGGLSADEYLRGFGERMGYPLSAAQWVEARRVAMEPDQAVLALARLLRMARPVGMFTNNPWLLQRHITDVFPAVMLSEIELALRALIRLALSPERIVAAAKRCLSSAYGSEEKVPTLLEDMTFDNYQSLISHGEIWTDFEPVFGGTRTRTSGKLKEIGGIRNDLFHFKRELTMKDHQTLAAYRNWLLNKIKQVETHRKTETK